MKMKMVAELRQFGEAHAQNGEARTSDLLFRASIYVDQLERMNLGYRNRLTRLSNLKRGSDKGTRVAAPRADQSPAAKGETTP